MTAPAPTVWLPLPSSDTSALAAGRAIHPSPGVGDAPGLIRPRRVLVQPADAPLSQQPGEAGLLQSVADGLGGCAHNAALVSGDHRNTPVPDLVGSWSEVAAWTGFRMPSGSG